MDAERGRKQVSQHPALPYLRNSEKGKIVTAAEAVRLIRDGEARVFEPHQRNVVNEWEVSRNPPTRI